MPIERPTVLVLGAGASQPYGFPTGIGLRDKICRSLGEPIHRMLLQRYGFSDEQVCGFSENLQHGAFSSVDAFLEQDSRYLRIGKIAVALALLPFERHEKLFPPVVQSQNHWYEYLINRMDPGGPGWHKNRLAVVTFNYDRSFEHYFMTVLSQRTKAPPEEIAALFRRVDVIHVHGQLGGYPALTDGGVSYGARNSRDSVELAAQAVRVVSEAGDDLEPFQRASARLQEAERAYFLGFGFADASVRRLDVFANGSRSWFPGQLDGTSKGVSDRDWLRISRDLFQGQLRGTRFRRSVAQFIRERASLL